MFALLSLGMFCDSSEHVERSLVVDGPVDRKCAEAAAATVGTVRPWRKRSADVDIKRPQGVAELSLSVDASSGESKVTVGGGRVVWEGNLLSVTEVSLMLSAAQDVLAAVKRRCLPPHAKVTERCLQPARLGPTCRSE